MQTRRDETDRTEGTSSVIKAVRCHLEEDGGTLLRAGVQSESAAAFLEEIARPAVATAYLVRVADLAALRAAGVPVTDCRRKHPSKGLAFHLLGQPETALIEGRYEQPGRVVEAVEKLLAQAARAKERQAYVIGVEPALYADPEVAPAAASAAGSAGEGQRHALLARLRESIEPGVLALHGAALEQDYVGESLATQFVRTQILLAGPKTFNVLIEGETGTGKELVARAIHRCGPRRESGLEVVNCAAIPTELLESELFGTHRGGFTGAVNRAGLWVRANKGTLFLDEVAELRAQHQSALLRALQENEVRAIGGQVIQNLDVRIVAATNGDLAAAVAAGRFREDLFYRLTQFTIRVPPLRARPMDLRPIAEHMWRNVTGDPKAVLAERLLVFLAQYHWPGNARELKSVLYRIHACLGVDDLRISDVRDLLAYDRHPLGGSARSGLGAQSRVEALLHLQRVAATLRTAQMALQGYLQDAESDGRLGLAAQTLAMEMREELQAHCERPALFVSPGTFLAVHTVDGHLDVLLDRLSGGGAGAQEYWRSSVVPALEDASTKVQGSIGELRVSRARAVSS